MLCPIPSSMPYSGNELSHDENILCDEVAVGGLEFHEVGAVGQMDVQAGDAAVDRHHLLYHEFAANVIPFDLLGCCVAEPADIEGSRRGIGIDADGRGLFK